MISAILLPRSIHIARGASFSKASLKEQLPQDYLPFPTSQHQPIAKYSIPPNKQSLEDNAKGRTKSSLSPPLWIFHFPLHLRIYNSTLQRIEVIGNSRSVPDGLLWARGV